jgi:3D (Asp-Asp-Asp) domain-containing protein
VRHSGARTTESDLNVITVDASVSWRRAGDVSVTTVPNVSGAIHGRVIDRHFETTVEVDKASLDPGATE